MMILSLYHVAEMSFIEFGKWGRGCDITSWRKGQMP